MHDERGVLVGRPDVRDCAAHHRRGCRSKSSRKEPGHKHRLNVGSPVGEVSEPETCLTLNSQSGRHVHKETAEAAEEVDWLSAEFLAERRGYERNEGEAERKRRQTDRRLEFCRVQVPCQRREAERVCTRGRSYRRNAMRGW